MSITRSLPAIDEYVDQMAAVVKRPRRTGEVLDVAFRLMRVTFRHSAILVAIAAAPAIFALVLIAWATDSESSGMLFGFANLLTGCLATTAFCTMTALANDAYEGHTMSLRSAIPRGLRRTLWFILWAIVVSIVWMLAMIPISIAFSLLFKAFAGVFGFVIQRAPLTFGIVSTIALFVVMFLFGARFLPSVPLVIVERNGPFAAIGRSWNLTAGRSMPLSGLLSVLVLGGWIVPPFVFGIVIGLLRSVSSLGAASIAVALQTGIALTTAGLLFLSLWACATVAVWQDLLVRKEAVDLVQLAEQMGAPTMLGSGQPFFSAAHPMAPPQFPPPGYPLQQPHALIFATTPMHTTPQGASRNPSPFTVQQPLSAYPPATNWAAASTYAPELSNRPAFTHLPPPPPPPSRPHTGPDIDTAADGDA